MLGMIGTLASLCAFQSVFVACYIGNAGSFPKPLRPEEEEYYIERMLAGDTEAKNVLIEHNLRLVAHVIKKYVPFGNRDTEDLLSIGTIGLMKGISSYNNQHKTKLATYAAKCIENALHPLWKQIAATRLGSGCFYKDISMVCPSQVSERMISFKNVRCNAIGTRKK